MARTRTHVAHHKRVKRILKRAKGYYGARSKLLGPARDTVRRAGRYATRDRRARKREFRALWITRLSAACQERELSYNQLIHGLKLANCDVNRKMLSEIAIVDAAAFDKLVGLARSHLSKRSAA